MILVDNIYVMFFEFITCNKSLTYNALYKKRSQVS